MDKLVYSDELLNVPYSTMDVVVEVAQLRIKPAADGVIERVQLSIEVLVSVGGGLWRHCRVEHSAQKGRYMVAAPPPGMDRLPADTVVCEASVLALSALEEWKKRVCACCLTVAPARLEVCCSACEQAFYCDTKCRSSHATRGGVGSAAHSLLCPALQQFGALKKYGKSLMAVLRLVLEVLARRHASGEESHNHLGGVAGDGDGDGDSPVGRDGMGGDDGAGGGLLQEHLQMFHTLESHPPRRNAKEAGEWIRACTLFRRALCACEWWPRVSGVPLVCSDDELHSLVSRLDSNCFGCFIESGKAPALFGHGCYPAASMFNHSCAPNCSASTGLRKMTVSAPDASQHSLSSTHALPL